MVDLRPGIGWEIVKKRPALVISSDLVNEFSPIVIVIPVSSQVAEVSGPERVLLPKDTVGLAKDSVVVVHQVRAIDKSRVTKRIGSLSKTKLAEVEEALQIVLGMKELD